MSASLGIPAELDPAVALVPDEVVPVVVPGGKTGLGAVLGEVFSSCANALIDVTTANPKQTLTNRVG